MLLEYMGIPIEEKLPSNADEIGLPFWKQKSLNGNPFAMAAENAAYINWRMKTQQKFSIRRLHALCWI